MYARSSKVRGDPGRIDEAIGLVRDEILPAVMQMPGCLGLSMLVDRASGEGIVTTSWESAEAMRATADAVRPMRDRATALLGGFAEVQEWEIAVMHRNHHTLEGSCVRSTWLRADPAAVDRALDIYRMGVLPRMEDLDGFCSASLLIDRATGLSVSSVAFDTREAMERTRATGEQLRRSTTEEIGAEILDVCEYDLVLAHLHVPEMA